MVIAFEASILLATPKSRKNSTLLSVQHEKG